MERRPGVAPPRRGEVHLVSEIRKTRPALVIQNDVANRWSPVTIVAAILSRSEERAYPTKVPIDPPEGNLENASVVMVNQIRTVDRRRLVRRLGRLRPESMRRVDRAIRISLGLAGV